MSENMEKYANNSDSSPKTSKILHDIRNMRTLTPEQIATIRKMTADEKMEIILTYDGVLENLSDIVNNM